MCKMAMSLPFWHFTVYDLHPISPGSVKVQSLNEDSWKGLGSRVLSRTYIVVNEYHTRNIRSHQISNCFPSRRCVLVEAPKLHIMLPTYAANPPQPNKIYR